MRNLRFAFLATLLVMFSQPLTAAEFKAKKPTTYKASDFTEKELNLTGLTDNQKDQVLKILNEYNCVCGCTKGTWASCIKTDAHCPYSRPMGAAVAKMIEIGKKEANVISFLDTYKRGVENRQGKQKKAEDPNKIYPVITMNAPLTGSPDAPVTIIEYTDYQCPFCKRVQPTLKTLLKEYPDKIRFASMNNPLSFHSKALPAAMAARAAGKQGKFWEMRDLLFENSRALDDASLVKYAKKLGLDVEKFDNDRKSEELKAEILKEQKQAIQNGATGTPAFFINGKKLSGARPLAQFKTAVENALKDKKSTK